MVEQYAEKSSLLQGLTPIAQWSSAQWALFSKAGLTDIGKTRYRDSSARFGNTFFFLASGGNFLLSLPDGRPRSALSCTVGACTLRSLGGYDGGSAGGGNAPGHHCPGCFVYNIKLQCPPLSLALLCVSSCRGRRNCALNSCKAWMPSPSLASGLSPPPVVDYSRFPRYSFFSSPIGYTVMPPSKSNAIQE